MASTYGYITVAELELYMSIDFGALTKTYSDAQVEAWITQAERMINAHTQTTFTGTIPDGVIYITTDISYKIAINHMIDDGLDPIDNKGKKSEKYTKLWNEEEYVPMLKNKKNFYAKGYSRESGV